MFTFHLSYTLKDGTEVGYIVGPDDRIYLASHPSTEFEPNEIGFFVPESRIEEIEAFRPGDPRPDLFIATEWNDELDERLVELIDVLVSIRISHPRLIQLPLVVEEYPGE